MNQDDPEDLASGLQAMGILNALRTGDPRLDMILALLFPLLLKALTGLWRQWMPRIWALIFQPSNPPRQKHERTIEYTYRQNTWGGRQALDEDSQNTILIKAVQLYLHAHVKLNLSQADIELTSTENKHANIGGSRYRYSSYGNDDDSDNSFVAALKKYQIVQNPPEGRWHNLGSFGKDKLEPANVFLYIQTTREGDGENATHRQLFRLESAEGHAMDAFLEQAYTWYVQEVAKLDDKKVRYLYELQAEKGWGDDKDNRRRGRTYERYALSDEKTFDSLFFRQKKDLLCLLENFLQRKGKYAIAGYPHKLGILLHGPPGTGKTSLIKALAQHTGRSIVNINLAKVSTNSELMSIFFDPRKNVDGEYMPAKLGFKQVIYVLEDIDAAGNIVQRRDGKTSGPQSVTVPAATRSLWHMLLESPDEACKSLVENLLSLSERLQSEAEKTEGLKRLAHKLTNVTGLAALGELADNPALQRVGQQAMDTLQRLDRDRSKADQFLSTTATRLSNLLLHGAKVDDDFVDMLLGQAPSSTVKCAAESRTVGPASFMRGSAAEFGSDNIPSKKEKSPFWEDPDALHLSGLLNVLDGVVDSPGRIVIMTTNHVEQLDPALIRPGRIDLQLLLGFMQGRDAVDMLEHYYQTTLTESQRARTNAAMKLQEVTPAQLEQMTALYANVDDLLAATGVSNVRSDDGHSLPTTITTCPDSPTSVTCKVE